MELITLNNGQGKAGQIIYYLLTIAILLSIAMFLYFLYFINNDTIIKVVGTVSAILLALIWLIFEYRNKAVVIKNHESNITKFVLITKDGEYEKEWHNEGMNSFLIGKGTVLNEVDIELGDHPYSEYISNEHAVLNYSEGFWYIEDLESQNGVGLKKQGEEYSLKLKPLTSYKIDEGDIIYISKAKILVR